MSKPTVFVSYAHSADQAGWVQQFADSLGEQGVDVWLDSDRIKPGESIPDAIGSGLRSSDAIVAILGAADLDRPSILFELGAAFALDKRIIPIIEDDVDPNRLPLSVRTRQSVRRNDPKEVATVVASALAGSPIAEAGDPRSG